MLTNWKSKIKYKIKHKIKLYSFYSNVVAVNLQIFSQLLLQYLMDKLNKVWCNVLIFVFC